MSGSPSGPGCASAAIAAPRSIRPVIYLFPPPRKGLMEAAGITAQDLDYVIILATITPDTALPFLGQLAAGQAGLPLRPSLSTWPRPAPGSSSPWMWPPRYIKSGKAKTILVAASEVMTRTLDLDRPHHLHPVGRRRGSGGAHRRRGRAPIYWTPMWAPTGPTARTCFCPAAGSLNHSGDP